MADRGEPRQEATRPVAITCTLETLFHLMAQLDEATRRPGPVSVLSVGPFPPLWPEAVGPSARFWVGPEVAACLLAEAVAPREPESSRPLASVTLCVTPESFREAARRVARESSAVAGHDIAEQVRALADRQDLAVTSGTIAAQAFLQLAQALDREHSAIRDQERASLEIRARLEQVERSRAHAAIARALGHHFHNRLEVIQARADLTALCHDDDDTRRCAQQIQTACRSCCDTLVRLESYTSRRPVNSGAHYPADEAVTQALNGLEHFLEACRAVQSGGFQMIRELDCDTPLHLAREDLQAVIEALVVNAAEAMPEGGDLTVRTRRQDGWAVIEVADTGMGMPEDVANRIFNPFYTTKGGARTGLSLSQVHAIVVENGGSIDVRTHEGEGTTFAVRLPGFLSDRVTGADCARSAGSGAVLVIEDEDDVRTALVELLEKMGYEVVGASGGHVAESIIKEQPIGLVLTDLGLPDLTAFSLARRLRAGGLAVPIVLLTGWGNDVEPATASEAGIDLVLTKPIAARSLGEALSALGMVPEPTARRRVD
jgi:signal transduction histidine kinase/CheY-like chemotaxis protein